MTPETGESARLPRDVIALASLRLRKVYCFGLFPGGRLWDGFRVVNGIVMVEEYGSPPSLMVLSASASSVPSAEFGNYTISYDLRARRLLYWIFFRGGARSEGGKEMEMEVSIVTDRKTMGFFS